jgi:UDPglucose 6-dehydrogenase/GDP-mannose 6-dehydrogenase
MMRVSVVGTGYVGLVTGVCLAEKGHSVVCVDIDSEKIESINCGITPIYEAGLEELLVKNLGARFSATVNLREAILGSELTLIAVGTPFDGQSIDLTYIKQVAGEIGDLLREKSGYHLVVVKSTVVPGTTDNVVLRILEQRSGKTAGRDFGLGMNPEFLTEGVAVRDFMLPDRIVLGGIDERSCAVLETLYQPFRGVKIIKTNNKTAEMIKYASNALLATMISFSNELGNLCASIGGVDIVDVMNGVHTSNYLSMALPNGERATAPIASFLMAGCGFGGSCLPKDVKALISHGRARGVSMQLLEAVIQVNEQQPGQMISLLQKHFSALKGLHVGILGLAFKPDTDDMRESPATPIIRALLKQGVIVKAYDPAAIHEARRVFGDSIIYCSTPSEALAGSHAVMLVTRWEEFRDIPELLSSIKPQPLFIDGRRMLGRHDFSMYEGIGL